MHWSYMTSKTWKIRCQRWGEVQILLEPAKFVWISRREMGNSKASNQRLSDVKFNTIKLNATRVNKQQIIIFPTRKNLWGAITNNRSNKNTLQEDTWILTWKTFSMWEVKTTGTSQSVKLHYDQIRLHRESQITAQLVLNNQPNSNTTEMKQRTRNLKNSQTAVTVRGLYVTVPVTLEQSERSNWRTTKYEPADKISARSNGGRNSSSNQKILVLKRNAENATIVWDEFQLDPTVNKVSVAAGSFWAKLSLSLIFSLSFLSLSVSIDDYPLFEKP